MIVNVQISELSLPQLCCWFFLVIQTAFYPIPRVSGELVVESLLMDGTKRSREGQDWAGVFCVIIRYGSVCGPGEVSILFCSGCGSLRCWQSGTSMEFSNRSPDFTKKSCYLCSHVVEFHRTEYIICYRILLLASYIRFPSRLFFFLSDVLCIDLFHCPYITHFRPPWLLFLPCILFFNSEEIFLDITEGFVHYYASSFGWDVSVHVED